MAEHGGRPLSPGADAIQEANRGELRGLSGRDTAKSPRAYASHAGDKQHK
jgi:hypothetical protein